MSDFIPDTKNANRGTARGQKMIVGSIQRSGFGRSVVVDKDGRIIGGNKTIEATAEVLGTEVEPIIVESDGTRPIIHKRSDLDLSDPNPNNPARQLAYADNLASYYSFELDPAVTMADIEAGFDFEALDIRLPDLGELLDKSVKDLLGGDNGRDVEPQIDKAAELALKWGTQVGQIWELGAHRLACGDCTDKATVEAVMRGERADCGFTSPPYAVGVNYGEYQDTIENLREMLPKLSRIWLDFIVDGGFAVINFGDIAPARDVAKTDEPCEYPMAVEYWPVFRADGWLLWSRRIWCKPNPRVHSPWCIQSNRAATDWEHLWTWRKPGEPIIKRVDGELRSALGWYQSSLMHGVDVGKEVHGAGMALGISEWMINIHSRIDSIVLESFCGTGTTIISCQQLSRKARAIELDPDYVAVSIQRWVDLTGKEPKLLNG